MRYRALVCDYDGTPAHDGEVSSATVASLERLRLPGRRIGRVTGRFLDELTTVFDRLDPCDAVVGENCAVVNVPFTRETLILGATPPASFIEALRRTGATPLAVGRCMMSVPWYVCRVKGTPGFTNACGQRCIT